jgi:hypothetical protein
MAQLAGYHHAPRLPEPRLKYFQKFFNSNATQNEFKLHSNVLQLAQGAPLESSPNGSGTRSTQKPNEIQMAPSNKATRQRVQRVDSLLLSSTDNTHVSAPAGAGANVLTTGTTTKPSPDATTVGQSQATELFTAEQLHTLSDSYPDLDIDAEIPHWVAKSQVEDWALKFEGFRRWCAAAAKRAAAKAAPKPKKVARASKEDVAAAVAKQHGEALRNMPGVGGEGDLQQEARIKVWFRSIPGEYDADELLCYCYDNKLFDLYTPDSSQSKDNDAPAGANNVVKDELGIKRLKGSKWLHPGANRRAKPPKRQSWRGWLRGRRFVSLFAAALNWLWLG